MKNLLLFIVLTIFGCSAMTPTECTIYQDYGATPENSLIARKIEDPCLATRLLRTAAKLPAVEWEERYTEAFDEWAARVEVLVENNITYAELQEMVMLEVAKLNTKVGLIMVIVSDNILVFNEKTVMLPVDVELVLALIRHLRVEVAKMGIMV